MTDVARLHPDDIEAVAERVVELLRMAKIEAAISFDADAESVARAYGVSAPWVRANAEKLGGRRLGTGEKPPHRFSLAVVGERLDAMQASRQAPTRTSPAATRRSRKTQRGVSSLLPIKGRTEAL